MFLLRQIRILRHLILCMVLSFILSKGTLSVYAEGTDTLFNLYGISLGKTGNADEIAKEIKSIQDDIVGASIQANHSEFTNAFTDLEKNTNNKKISELNSNIQDIMNVNLTIANKFEKDIFTEDIHTLLSYDREYKKNTSRINNLLLELDILNNVKYDYSDFEFDFEGMSDLLETKRVLYIEALDNFNLGEVVNVKFPMPIERYVTSRFGNRIDPLDTSRTSFHAGTDYRAPNGTELYAMFNGVVISCGWSDTAGNFITIEHGDNVKTFVCHLSKILVTEGQVVNQYDLIGLTGGTGSRSTGPHLHLALYLNGSVCDVDKLFS